MPRPPKICSLVECNRKHMARSYCSKHYKHFRLTGNPISTRPWIAPKDGSSNHPLYSTWSSMKTRCYNQKEKTYKNYGSRGIKVCDRWLHSFANFLEDMGERPEKMTLDRINNDGDYSPDNCRWADGTTQNFNKRPLKKNKSGFVGVHRSKNRSEIRWVAALGARSNRLHIGTFDSPEEAYEAYAIKREAFT